MRGDRTALSLVAWSGAIFSCDDGGGADDPWAPPPRQERVAEAGAPASPPKCPQSAVWCPDVRPARGSQSGAQLGRLRLPTYASPRRRTAAVLSMQEQRRRPRPREPMSRSGLAKAPASIAVSDAFVERSVEFVASCGSTENIWTCGALDEHACSPLAASLWS